MRGNKEFAGKRPIEILEQLLFELIPGNYSPFGQSYDWRVSRHFSEYDYSGWEVIEEEFSQEYARVVSEIQEDWGKPRFKGTPETSGYPKWFRIWAIEMCYWVKEEGVAYVAFHREDRELPYCIMLGAITGVIVKCGVRERIKRRPGQGLDQACGLLEYHL